MRAMVSQNSNIPFSVKLVFRVFGPWISFGYQGAKHYGRELGIYRSASPGSYAQLYWENQGYLDGMKPGQSKYEPGRCTCDWNIFNIMIKIALVFYFFILILSFIFYPEVSFHLLFIFLIVLERYIHRYSLTEKYQSKLTFFKKIIGILLLMFFVISMLFGIWYMFRYLG